MPAPSPTAAAPAAAPAGRRGALARALALALVLGAVAATFAPALRGELVYDDLQVVARNPLLGSLANVPRFFAQGYWDFLGPEQARFTGYWRPLTATALALAQATLGPSPASYHALSLLLHLAATLTVYLLARRLAGSELVGLLAALVFGLHPVQVESVAWITAVNDPLQGLLSLLALLLFVRWRERGSRGAPLGAAACFALALLAKETGVAVLPMAVAIDLLRRRAPAEPGGALGGLATAPLRAYGPLALVLLLYVAARMAVFGSPWAGLDRVTTDFGVGPARLAALRVEVLGGAVRLLAWPADLSLFHRFRPSLPPAALLADGAWVLALAAALLLAWRRGARTLALALLLVPAALLPVSLRTASLGRFPLSERFLYVAAFGWALAVATAALRFLPRRAGVAALLAVAGLLAWRSHERLPAWRNEEALFRASAAESPRSPYVLWGLGRVLVERYLATRDPALLGEAFDVHERAARLVETERVDPDTDVLVTLPDLVAIELGQATAYLLEAEIDPLHDYGTPITLLRRLAARVREIRERGATHEIAPGVTFGHDVELEHVETTLGAALLRAGDLDAAEQALRSALAENPLSVEAHLNLGRVAARRGDFDLARRQLERALELRPGDVGTRVALAQALQEGGESERAVEIARGLEAELGERTPAEARLVVAAARLGAGRPAEALTALERALASEPRNGHAWYLKATAHLALDERADALLALQRAAENDPASFPAHYDLGAFLLQEGAPEDASRALARALALAPDAGMAARIEGALDGLPVPDAATASEIAAALVARGRADAAFAWTERALELDPDDDRALLVQGRLLLARGEPAAGAERLRRAAARRPGDLPLQLEAGELLLQVGRRAEGLEVLRPVPSLPTPRGWEEGAAEALRRRARELLDDVARSGEVGPPAPPSQATGSR